MESGIEKSSMKVIVNLISKSDFSDKQIVAVTGASLELVQKTRKHQGNTPQQATYGWQ